MVCRHHFKVTRQPGPADALKDQLLCELELQQTVAAAQIKHLLKIREDLETSRNSLAVLYDESPIGYVTLSSRGHIRDANASAARLLGISRERMLHLPFTFFAH